MQDGIHDEFEEINTLRRERIQDELRDAERTKRMVARHSDPTRVRALTREQWLEQFDREGADVVLNAVGLGHTAASWARYRGFPPALFREWCEANIDRKALIEARRASAELHAYDAVSVFDDPDSSRSMSAVHHTRAKSAAHQWAAARKDPENFGPPKAVDPPQAPVALNIYMGASDVPPEIEARITEKRAAKLARAPARFDPNTDRIVKRSDAHEAEEITDEVTDEVGKQAQNYFGPMEL